MMDITPVRIDREILPKDDIHDIIAKNITLHTNDIVVIAQKAISKAEGRMVSLDEVRPSALARGIAGEYNKDARVVHLVLREAEFIVRMGNGVIITQMYDGHVCANSGVDTSNVPDDSALLLPKDSNYSARQIRHKIKDRLNIDVGVIISDTVGRPFRVGQTDICVGCAGILPLINYTGKPDTHGKVMRVSVTAIADQLAGAAEIVMKKTDDTPVAVLRGVLCVGDGTSGDIIRSSGDLFKF